jgi:hypothetical protein
MGSQTNLSSPPLTAAVVSGEAEQTVLSNAAAATNRQSGSVEAGNPPLDTAAEAVADEIQLGEYLSGLFSDDDDDAADLCDEDDEALTERFDRAATRAMPLILHHGATSERSLFFTRGDRSGGIWLSNYKQPRWRKPRWVLISLQFVTFTDSDDPKLLGWCQGGPCLASSGSRLYEILGGNSRVDAPSTWCGQEHQPCSCCGQLLRRLGGQQMLATILQLSQPTVIGEGGTIVTPPMCINGTPCCAVRAKDGDDSWGIVSAEGASRCFSCSSRSRCPHMPLVPGHEPAKVQRLTEAAFEAEFDKHWDGDTQQQRLCRISREPLTQDLCSDLAVHSLICGALQH